MSKEKLLLIGGLFGVIGVGVASAYGTYKAYPKIMQMQKEGKKKTVIAKGIVKDYIPAIGTAAVTGGLFIANQVLGNKKMAELRYSLKKAKEQNTIVKSWFKEQSNAIEKHVPDEIKEEIKNDISLAQGTKAVETKGLFTIYYDEVSDSYFESTESDILRAQNEINKSLVTNGFCYYKDFYDSLGVSLSPAYHTIRWSYRTAHACWVEPWVDIEIGPPIKTKKNEPLILDGVPIKEYRNLIFRLWKIRKTKSGFEYLFRYIPKLIFIRRLLK